MTTMTRTVLLAFAVIAFYCTTAISHTEGFAFIAIVGAIGYYLRDHAVTEPPSIEDELRMLLEAQ